MSSEAENYGPLFKRLAEHVKHHIREDERDLLPGARDQLGQERLEYLGDQMVRRRRELTPPRPYLLRDTLRQAKSVVTMAYDALTGAESAQPPARRSAKSAPKRRIASPKQVVHATAKQRSSRAGAQRRKLSARG
jgi:hypothetical protein